MDEAAKQGEPAIGIAPEENRGTTVFNSLELFGEQRGGRPYYWAAAALAIVAIIAFAAFSAVDETGAAGGVFLGGIVVLGVTLLAFFASGKVSVGGAQRLATRDLLRALGESSPDALIIMRGDGAVLYANPAYRTLMGSSAMDGAMDRLLPLDRVFAGYPEVSGPLYRLSRNVLDGGDAAETVVLPEEGGQRRRVRISVRPIGAGIENQELDQRAGREEAMFLWQVTDLGEVSGAQDEKAPTTTDHWLENQAIPCFAFDAEGKVTGLNDRLRDLLNQSANDDQVLGSAWQDLFPGLKGIQGQESQTVFRAQLSATQSGPADLTVMIVPDRENAENRIALVQAEPAKGNAAAIPTSRPAVSADVLENAPIAIAWVDTTGKITHSNAACRTLVGDNAAAGKLLMGLFDDGFQSDVQSAFDAACNGDASHLPGELRLSTQRDMFSQVSILPGAVDPDAADDTAAIVYLIDTTEQKTLEVQFAQSQKMQAVGQLAGGVAHDFNNMLTAMIGFCDLLLAKHQPGDPSFADIMQIKQNANRAANLVRHLLAFSRQQTLRPSVLWLPDTIADLKDLLKRLLGENVSLDIKHDRDLGQVKIDEGQFEQAIINLCVNARDAMPDGGTVTIRTENISKEQAGKLGHALMPAADYVMIEVADTGTGIAKEDLGKIFEPFFTTKEVGQGTGLGLSMVYGVVKQTGGFIFPESTVGKGTAFKIYLPLHVEAEKVETEAAPTPESLAKRDLTGMGKILLVEDEEAVRSFASRALSTRGYTVLEAPNGDIALDLMREQGAEIDLVISDVVMPEMDGPTLVRESKEFCPDAKIIFISGYAEDAFQKNLDPEEEFTFLPKPFSLKQLAEKVKEVMKTAG